MIYGLLITLVGALLLSFGMSQPFWYLCVSYTLLCVGSGWCVVEWYGLTEKIKKLDKYIQNHTGK